MPTLFPPLDFEGDESYAHGSDVLPAGLRANFETLNAIIRAQRRLEQESGQRSSDVIIGRKRKNSASDSSNSTLDGSDDDVDLDVSDPSLGELENQKFETAVSVAIAAEEEISRLTNGIAELEALLLQQGGNIDSADVAFPSLPPFVPVESSHFDQGASERSRPRGTSHATKKEMDIRGSRSD